MSMTFARRGPRDDSEKQRQEADMKRELRRTAVRHEVLRRAARWGLVAMISALIWPAGAGAEVSRVEIASRRDVAAGRSFGSVGPYERLTGKIYFVIDPPNQRNKGIADLETAPKNAAGKIQASAAPARIKPRDAP